MFLDSRSRRLSPAILQQPGIQAVSHGFPCFIHYSVLQKKLKREAKMKEEEKNEVKLCAGNAFIHRKQRRHVCPAQGGTAVWTSDHSAGLLSICFTTDCNNDRVTAAFFTTILSQSQTREVKTEWYFVSLSSLVLQNPYLLLTRSVMCKAHCSTCKVAQGKSMVILWTSTPCTGSNICLSSQAACEQHLARQDIWLN